LPEPLVQRLAVPDLATRLLGFADDLAVSKTSAAGPGAQL
jgi:hypothetical protein